MSDSLLPRAPMLLVASHSIANQKYSVGWYCSGGVVPCRRGGAGTHSGWSEGRD